MTEEKSNKFLDVERKAAELTETLEQLIQTIGLYKDSKEELDKVRMNLYGLITATKDAAVSNKEIIQRLKDVDAADLNIRLKALDERFSKTNQELIEIIRTVDERFLKTNQELIKTIRSSDEMNKINNENIVKSLKALNQNKTIIAVRKETDKIREAHDKMQVELTKQNNKVTILLVVSIILSIGSIVFTAIH